MPCNRVTEHAAELGAEDSDSSGGRDCMDTGGVRTEAKICALSPAPRPKSSTRTRSSPGDASARRLRACLATRSGTWHRSAMAASADGSTAKAGTAYPKRPGFFGLFAQT